MEEGEGEGLESAVIVEENQEKKKNIPDAPLLVGPTLPGDIIHVDDLSKKISVDDIKADE